MKNEIHFVSYNTVIEVRKCALGVLLAPIDSIVACYDPDAMCISHRTVGDNIIIGEKGCQSVPLGGAVTNRNKQRRRLLYLLTEPLFRTVCDSVLLLSVQTG